MRRLSFMSLIKDKRNITRNSVSQFGYQLVATAYQNDNLGITLDPDAIGA